MNKETIKKASEIIFANEGGYSSVNADDNGAVSVGRIQWHATRALNLLKKIVKALGEAGAKEYLSESLYTEITTAKTWSSRTVNTLEAASLKALLSTEESHKVQDEQTEADVTSYLTHIEKLGVTDESAQIFMADIENQGGAGASERIIKAAEGADLDSLYLSAKADSVFSRYMARRDRVYKKLTGHAFGEQPYEGELYEVRYGDTLSKIAVKYGTTVNELAELNGITNPNLIRTGDVLKIPVQNTADDITEPADTPEAVDKGTENTFYIVERGDSLSRIGARLGVAWRDIADINCIKAPYTIYIGQALVVPSPVNNTKPETAPAITHTVVRGNTLSALAQKYNTTVAAILEANRERYRSISADYIVVGWELVIPEGKT